VCAITWTVCTTAQSYKLIYDVGSTTTKLSATKCWTCWQSSHQQPGVSQFNWINIKHVTQRWPYEAWCYVTQWPCTLILYMFVSYFMIPPDCVGESVNVFRLFCFPVPYQICITILPQSTPLSYQQ